MSKKICKIEECDGKHKGLGFCKKHLKRFKKYGDPLFLKFGREREMHKLSNSPEYRIWNAMLQRCSNKHHKHYKRYGGRGIKVCDRWKNSFLAFYEDMGLKPFSKAQIDREDNDGDYTPDNCRWNTAAENSHNRRDNVLNWFTVRSLRRLYNLQKYTQKELCLIFGLKKGVIWTVTHNKTWKENSLL